MALTYKEYMKELDDNDTLNTKRERVVESIASKFYNGEKAVVGDVTYDQDDYIVTLSESKEFEKLLELARKGHLVSDFLQNLMKKVANEYANDIVSGMGESQILGYDTKY